MSAAAASNPDRRRRRRLPRVLLQQVYLLVPSPSGGFDRIAAKVIDVHDTGCGVEIAQPIRCGTDLSIQELAVEHLSHSLSNVRCHVRWCRQRVLNCYRAGLEFCDGLATAGSAKAGNLAEPSIEFSDDFYEILQLSPNADLDTIHRVYRILAQRFHPDNQDSGDELLFRKISEAYKTVSDPERRASYDATHRGILRAKWRLIEHTRDMGSVESEKTKRSGILGLLYSKRVSNPNHPTLNLAEMEDLLGVPREHLEFTLWYLRDGGCITRTDNGRYAITVKGVDLAESSPINLRPDRLLPASSSEKPTAV